MKNQLFTELTSEEAANLSGGATELRLNYFEVIDTQESRDEPYLKIGTKTIWSKDNVGIGGHKVKKTVYIPTDGSLTLNLFEKDDGWVDKIDDLLGSNTIYDGVRGKDLTAKFGQNGANYILHYDAVDY